jgi:sulfatase maturation enzyme AslB (radical SAM superfamily)
MSELFINIKAIKNMQAEFDQTSEKVRRERAEQAAKKFTVWPHIIPIRSIHDYNSDISKGPNYADKPSGIYHPLTSEYIVPDPTEWAVIDSLTTPQDIHQLKSSTKLDDKSVRGAVAELSSLHILTPEGQDLRLKMEPDLSETEMYLSVTEACNFGCKGCATAIDRFPKGMARTMDRETMEILLKNAARSAVEKGVTKMRVKWAGGEPLMPKPFGAILNGQNLIDELRERYPSLEITQAILTNGSYLTPENIDSLSQMNAHVAVSLWGLGKENDEERSVKRERDSFNAIASGLRLLHESRIPYNINHVLTPSNADKFPEFVEAFWEIESENFLGNDWNWPDGKSPIPLNVSFFRPQTIAQIEALNTHGYEQILKGLRGGFAKIHELIQRGIPLPPLDEIDYLQLNKPLPATCGSGIGSYFAAGSSGVASCHEGLFGMPGNIGEMNNRNMLDLANAEYDGRQNLLLGQNIIFNGIDATTALALSHHGGSGCPRTSRVENGGNLGNSASIAEKLYAPILPELLALEMQRRMTM